MRGFRLGFVLTVAVLVPNIGNAQVFKSPTPPPEKTAAGASWLINGQPIMVGGITYYPTRAFRQFDPEVLVQTGRFDGVPVYSDTTIEVNSEIYIPVASTQLRVYERRREGELAGTTGSHVPRFPVETPDVVAADDATATSDLAVATGGTVVPRAVADAAVLTDRARPRRNVMTAVPAGATNGVWLPFNGARWYSDGPAVSFSPDRFEPVGEYHGFPVYRDKTSDSDDIWVSVVKDGPLAPYKKK
jgi:hypothetical protein